jgi:hypothetical protein
MYSNIYFVKESTTTREAASTVPIIIFWIQNDYKSRRLQQVLVRESISDSHGSEY